MPSATSAGWGPALNEGPKKELVIACACKDTTTFHNQLIHKIIYIVNTDGKLCLGSLVLETMDP